MNHYSYLKVYPQGILAQHVLDFAEIPSFNELVNVDQDNDNTISGGEVDRYLANLKDTFVPGFRCQVFVDKKPVEVSPQLLSPNIVLSHGQAGMTCIQVQMAVGIPLSSLQPGQQVEVAFADENITQIKGFREVRISQQDGVTIVPDSVTNENKYPIVNPVDGLFGMEGLTARFKYTVNEAIPFQPNISPVESFVDPASIPQIPIEPDAGGNYSIVKSPLEPDPKVQSQISMLQPRTQINADTALAESSGAKNGTASATETEAFPVSSTSRAEAKGDEAWASLIQADDFSPWFVITAILASVMYGMAHALSPGHGKTVVAAYLIGSRGTVFHAFFLGLIVTLTHVSSVIALGLIVLYFQSYIQSEVLYASVELISGLFIVWIGGILFFKRYNAYQRYKLQTAHATAGHTHHPHTHPHDHNPNPRAHSHHPDHHHEHPHTHDHPHDHPHHHDHPRHDHSHEHGHPHEHSEHHHHDHLHEHGHHHHSWLDEDHEHGEHTHTHEIPQGATWWDLLVLGITGGIVPCPAAIVVLLMAIATHKLVFGMTLILFFSMGLAVVLIAIGITMVTAKHLFDRFSDQGAFARMLQIVSPALVTFLGFVIIARAMVTAGWITIHL